MIENTNIAIEISINIEGELLFEINEEHTIIIIIDDIGPKIIVINANISALLIFSKFGMTINRFMI